MALYNRKYSKGDKCKVPGCERDAIAAGLCRPCYQWERSWGKRTPGEREQRENQLKLWTARMDRLQASKQAPRESAIERAHKRWKKKARR